MMENLSIKATLSTITLLAASFLLTACDQTPPENSYLEKNSEFEQPSARDGEKEMMSKTTISEEENLSNGNMLNIARDIAKLQFETDDYVTLLKQSQNSLEQAIQDKNTRQLQHAAGDLKQELHGLHDTLLSLNLKSHEVNQIRQSLLSANQQLLTMPLLHGQTDLSKIDFAKIEKQFNTIQMNMVKLASLVLNNSTVSNNTKA
ncbi:hypothetical protein [Acinetobacter modestus]|uniref:Lipoprotein n=1 Tax=Acinetobacter modestus TaxID=1776740 RepID=A0ABP2U222_9GAMM|nr:hypothetical protein [Acinetobacter modestus]ENU28615.1 hypothetical protein F992_00031 [Acinetobacter modestus]GGA29897.1 hypothetical protein GCM10017554_29000 [Acinetobacter modestus]